MLQLPHRNKTKTILLLKKKKIGANSPCVWLEPADPRQSTPLSGVCVGCDQNSGNIGVHQWLIPACLGAESGWCHALLMSFCPPPYLNISAWVNPACRPVINKDPHNDWWLDYRYQLDPYDPQREGRTLRDCVCIDKALGKPSNAPYKRTYSLSPPPFLASPLWYNVDPFQRGTLWIELGRVEWTPDAASAPLDAFGHYHKYLGAVPPLLHCRSCRRGISKSQGGLTGPNMY